MRLLTAPALVLALTLTGKGGNSHEFWIEPLTFVVKADDPIKGHIRIGEMMKGDEFGFVPQEFTRFEFDGPKGLHPVKGRLGDFPALSLPPQGNGLVAVVHFPTDELVTYSSWEEFKSFIADKDLTGTLETHQKQNWPQQGFREVYSRYAKTLIASGTGKGTDRNFRLETEIVALANPYDNDLKGSLPVQVLYRGRPRKNIQIQVFSRRGPGSAVAKTRLRTDSKGVAKILVLPQTDYLINAVTMRRPNFEKKLDRDVYWESLWASLTFRIP